MTHNRVRLYAVILTASTLFASLIGASFGVGKPRISRYGIERAPPLVERALEVFAVASGVAAVALGTLLMLCFRAYLDDRPPPWRIEGVEATYADLVLVGVMLLSTLSSLWIAFRG
ncbi:MAG: hypothetical protein AAF772_08165 [Acidobacteriota bacterium]